MMKSPRQKYTTQAGFTLLELLVAIMILTMIMTAAMGAVRVASRSFETGIVRSDETARIRVMTNVLRWQFRQLLPVKWEENRQEFIAFDGDRRHVQFIAPAPGSSTGPGYLVYRLSSGQPDTPNAFVLDFAPFDPGADHFEMPANSGRELLASNLIVRFDYFGAMDELDQPEWHDRWSSGSAKLPTLVRMQLASSGQEWPELLFRVRFEERE
jgi:general secretion pathway protein J